MAVKITLPRTKILTGGVLKSIADDLKAVANTKITSNNGDSIYNYESQEFLEEVLTHDNVLTLVNEGAEIEGYIMYAETDSSIYNKLVPEGLKSRTNKVLNNGVGTTEVVKTFVNWANDHLTQTFKSDYTKLYVMTNPLIDYLTGTELKIVVDGFGVVLKTLKEYKAMVDAGEIVES